MRGAAAASRQQTLQTAKPVLAGAQKPLKVFDITRSSPVDQPMPAKTYRLKSKRRRKLQRAHELHRAAVILYDRHGAKQRVPPLPEPTHPAKSAVQLAWHGRASAGNSRPKSCLAASAHDRTVVAG